LTRSNFYSSTWVYSTDARWRSNDYGSRSGSAGRHYVVVVEVVQVIKVKVVSIEPVE
jgi:hypothetical protein